MRALSLPFLLAVTACTAHGARFSTSEAQTPLQLVQHDEALSWDKEPDVDATGNLIFNSMSELMLLWPNTVIVQGHSIAPVSIPVGTVFYHGRPDPNIPSKPEWLAFDFEHSYFFAHGENGHVLTLATSRELRLIDFDGLSAHMSPDTAEIVQFGEVKDGGGWGGDGGNDGLAGRLCGWAAPLGIDGFIRMEGHFEVIHCNFSDSLTLLSALKVLPTAGRGPGGGGPGRRRPGGPGREPRNDTIREFPGFASPEGWIGSLPTDVGREVDVAGHWHDRAPGETRVRVQYDKVISFYDPEVTSLIEGRRGKPREEHRIKGISKEQGIMKRAELEEAVKRSWNSADGSGVDWASIIRVVVERYADRLAVLAHTLSAGSYSTVREGAYKARQQVLIMLAPHFTTADTPGADGLVSKAWLTPVVDRCALRHTQGLPTELLTKQERLIRGAVEDVMHEICRRLARMFHIAYGIESEQLNEANVQSAVDAMQIEVNDVIKWLDWVQVWVKCDPGCATEEMCVISGKGDARRQPKCVARPNV
ncbi:hypothetical protein FB451DRAFT_1214831 [Mycena latifolia]|nr:hypothetical protein FB451DRAFT_1214831 [Mycena latifolia]